MPARSDGRFFFGTFNSPLDIEFIARDVPAMGWRRMQLEPAAPVEDVVDSATQIEVDEFEVQVEPAGTLSVRMGDQRFTGLFDVEDLGDRGDTYDADLLDDGQRLQWVRVETQRIQQANGIQRLEVRRFYRLPAQLEEERERRCDEDVEISLWVEATLVPGVQRVDFKVRLENRARDHRLRLLFPTHQKTENFLAASTFDAMERSTKPQDDADWVHPAARTFPQQGWVSVNGLHLVAPGLPEAEVTPQGTLALTLLRAVGWLARPDLRSRPGPAGPVNATPEAQCLRTVEVSLSLLPECNSSAARDAEAGLRAVWAGEKPDAGNDELLPEGSPILELEPASLVLTSFKPAREPGCAIVRVLNPSEESVTARMRFGFEVSAMQALRLDEEPIGLLLTRESGSWNFEVGAKQLRTFLLHP